MTKQFEPARQHDWSSWSWRIQQALTSDKGDVPGWVLVSLMSAGLVILLWTLAGPLLTQVFEDALARVTANF